MRIVSIADVWLTTSTGCRLLLREVCHVPDLDKEPNRPNSDKELNRPQKDWTPEPDKTPNRIQMKNRWHKTKDEDTLLEKKEPLCRFSDEERVLLTDEGELESFKEAKRDTYTHIVRN